MDRPKLKHVEFVDADASCARCDAAAVVRIRNGESYCARHAQDKARELIASIPTLKVRS